MEKLEIIHPIPLIPSKRPVFVIAKRLFTPKQCQLLLTFAETHRRYYQSGGRGDTRDVEIFYLYPTDLDWPFTKVGTAAVERNVWNFSLSGFAHPMRIQRYNKGGYTDEHSDFEYETPDPSKITAVIPLVDRKSWSGGQIRIGNHALSPRIDIGDCLLFPSFYSHGVTRVSRGTRIILTAWLAGPTFI